MQPGTEDFSWAVLLPLFGACLNAAREIITRRVIGGESSISMALTAMLLVSGTAAAVAPFVWVTPITAHIGLLALAGACLSFGLVLAFEAIRSADVSIVSPFQYSSMLWATVIGFAVWSDIPSWPTIVGATLIVAGGLVILRREGISVHDA
jgi:drug/metabolite transporter (DMT)-like permease